MFDLERYHDTQPIVRIKHADEVRRCCRYFNDLARNRKGSLAAVVKNDGYGFGIPNILPPILETGITQIYTSDISEAGAIRQAGFQGKLFILNGFRNGLAKEFEALDAIPVLSSRRQIEDFCAVALEAKERKAASLHFDTGMNRNGLPFDDIRWVEENWDNITRAINVDHYLTHLHSVDLDRESGQAASLDQIARFRSCIEKLPQRPVSIFATHGALYIDSGHTSDLENQIHRIGVGLLGDIYDRPLAVEVHARINETRTLKKGEAVGYDQIFRAPENMRIAVVEIGYGDGYARGLAVGNGSACDSKAPFMMIDGSPCPVVGKISMNMTTVDISNLPNWPLKNGFAEVVGPHVDIRQLSDYAGTVPEEMLIGLQTRNRRAKDFVLGG